MFFDLVRTEEHWSVLISSPNLDEDGALMILMLRNGNDEDYTLNEYMVGLHLASSHVFKCGRFVLIEPRILRSCEPLIFQYLFMYSR